MTASARNDLTLDGMAGCTNPDHAFGCPCGMGGDPIEARCYLCRTPDDGVFVTIDGAVRLVCDRCYDRSSPEIPLDMTEDEEFDNREGQPEFNGAFNRW